MAFLQVKNNLGDINNICEAQKTLGLMSMAYQCKNNVDIQGGKIAVSNLRIKYPNVGSNYVLVAKNSNGDVMWKRQALQEWMEKSPSEILLSSFSNDQNYIKETEINVTISNYIDDFRDTIINNNLVVDSISISNIKVNNNFVFIPENSNLIDKPCILTNGGLGSNIYFSLIDQSFSNDDMHTVCSSRAVSNLYGIVRNVQSSLPTDTGSTYMISTNNLNEVGFDPSIAVGNLGLKESFITKNLTLSNVYFDTPDIIPEINYNKKYFLYRHEDTLSYKEIVNVVTYDNDINASTVNPASSKSVYDLYTNLNNAVNDRLLKSNVLSEFFEPLDDGSVNPQINLFKERLEAVGVQQVAFTSNWYHLGNAPRKLSAFSNTDFNDETLFIYGKCNLSDLTNPTQAMINLGVSTVGRTGNFADLLLPTSISNIITADDFLSAIPGIPFLVKTEFLSELSGNAAYARSNLGIHDMATFSQYNVEIFNGNIGACNVVINSNLRYLHSNTSIEGAGINGSNIFMKCFTSDGLAKWEALPMAETTLSTQGIVYLTNDLTNSSSNVAITAYALSNVFYNNDNITNLVPLANSTGYGIVRTTNEYESPSEVSENMVINSIGISNMYYELNSNIDNVKDILNIGTTELIYARLVDVTVSNYGDDILQLTDKSSGNNRKTEISLNFPNTNNEYLAADGTFKTIQPTTLTDMYGITLSNDITFQGDPNILEFHSSGNRIEFKNTIYTAGNGISIDTSTRTIVNTGIVTGHDTYFSTTLENTGNKITLNGGLIGNTGQIIIGTTDNTYLQYSLGSGYTFQPLNLNNFTSSSRGFVPIPPDSTLNYVLLSKTSWKSISEFFNENSPPVPVFNGNNNGLVENYSTSASDAVKSNLFLNANGQWINKSEMVDLTGAVTSLNIDSANNNVLSVSSSRNEVELGFHNANNNQVITKNADNEYVWRYPFELIRDEFTFPTGSSPANMYLNGVGDFIIPPSAMNFSAIMSIDVNNVLTITQPLNEILPLETSFTCNVTLNFVHKYREVLYGNGGNYIIYNNDGSITNITSFDDLNTSYVENYAHSNRVFTILGVRNYIDSYVNDFTENDIPGTFLDNKYFTTNATSNYMYNRFDHFRSTHVDTIDFKNDWKLITPFGVSNYVNDNYIKITDKSDNINFDLDDVNDGSTKTNILSVGALSNLLFNEIIQESYLNENNFKTNNVLSSETLSNYLRVNYINENKKFNYDTDFGNNYDKFVRASNVLYALHLNRNSKGVDDAFNGDKKFTTPLAVSNYVNTNYIKVNEKIGYTDDIETNLDDVVIGGSLSNYVKNIFYNQIQSSQSAGSFGNETIRNSFEQDDYKFPTTKTLKHYVEYTINDSDIIQDKIVNRLQAATFNFDDSETFNNFNTVDDKYTTPRAVSNYTNEYYIKRTQKRNENEFTINNLNNSLKTDILSIGALSNLLFNEVIQDSYLSFGNFNTNKVLSSTTMSNYVKNNYVNVDRIETSDDNYGDNYDDIHIPTTATTSNIVNYILDVDRYSDSTTFSALTTDTSLLINEFGLLNILNNVILGYEKHNNLDWTNDGTYTVNHSDFGTDYNPDSSYNCNIIPTVDLVKDLIDAKIANVTKNIENTSGLDGYSWTDSTSLSNSKFLPTIGLMKETINGLLQTGITLNMVDLVVDSFTINNQLRFFPDDDNREDIQDGKKFMTIDSDGYAIFRQIETISGFSNIVTVNDEYSMVTGTHTKTFGNNQFVCGEYNSSNNIYKQIGLLNDNIIVSGHDNAVNLVVGTGTANTDIDRANGFEVHSTGEVYVRSNLILGDTWRLSFDNETLTIEKREGNTYVQKHIFK